MAVLDLNKVKRPSLDLVLQDPLQTRVRVTIPNEGLIAELQALSPELMDIIKSGSQEGIAQIYEIAAKLISCNRDFIQINAQELRENYRMDLESAVLFFSAYMDFITAITNEKN